MNIEFWTLTWRLGGITFYLTTETKLNFQRPNFPGVYFDKWAFVWYGYYVEMLVTRCRLNRSKLAFILSPKKTCKIHLYKNGVKNQTKENYKKLFICFYWVVILELLGKVSRWIVLFSAANIFLKLRDDLTVSARRKCFF